ALVVLAHDAIAAGEGAGADLHSYVIAQLGRDANEQIVDAQLRRRIEEARGDVRLVRDDAHHAGDDVISVGEVEPGVRRRHDAGVRERLQVVGYDGGRVQHRLALAVGGILAGIDAGPQRRG